MGKTSAIRPQSQRWKRLLVAGLLVAVLVVLGSVLLFSGSAVGCDEIEDADGPALRCAFDAAVPPATVWQAMTRTGEPRSYYFDAVLEAEMVPGGRWRFLTDDLERLLAGGEILVIDPPRRFEQSFQAADLDDPPSRITVELSATPAGSHVVLTHDRFPRKTTTYRRFRGAHPLALSALQSVLETGELPLRARIYTLIFKPGMKTMTVRAEPWH